MHWRKMSLLEYINSEKRGFFLPDMATNGLELVGYTAYEVYEDPLKQLELAQKMNEVFESDFIYSLCDGIIFCETIGSEILKPDYDFPSVISHPIQRNEDLLKLEVPDPFSSGRSNSKANTIIATIARPKFKYLFTTQIDIDPAKKKIKVCTTSYIESIPITDGVKILL